MSRKISALAVLAKLADLDKQNEVFAFPLHTNLKYARIGKDGWGEITIAVSNHVVTNIDKFVGSLYMADAEAYKQVEKELEGGE